MTNAKRPPRRICPSCGGEHYAWNSSQICYRCRRPRPDGLGSLAREIRLERWKAKGII